MMSLIKAFKNKLWSAHDRRWVILIPCLWLVLFFLIPFFLVIKISLSESILAIPPFNPLLTWGSECVLTIRLNFETIGRLVTDNFYLGAFSSSLIMACWSTLTCLVVGYGIAYAISQVRSQWRFVLLLMIVLPFWTSFLVRIYAWMGLLGTEGTINSILLYLGIIHKPLSLLYNNFSVWIGIVYCYLPFMILPIYAILDKLDPVYLEAAHDLGCRPWQAFWKVTIPLSLPGIISGCILVFIPAIGEFVIPDLLGASDTLMIGRVLWMEFFSNRDWPMACTLAVAILLLFVVPVMIFQRFQLRENEENQ